MKRDKRDKYDIVPAQAGFYAGIIDARTHKVFWSPVIAWLIERRVTTNRPKSQPPDQKVSGIGRLMTLQMPERMALERGRRRDQECG